MASTNLEEIRSARAVFEDQSASGEQLSKQLSELAAYPELLSLYREHVAQLLGKLELLMSSSLEQRALSTTQAAKMLGMSVPTLRKLAHEGKLAHHFVGTHMRFVPNDLEVYQRRRRQGFQAVLELGAMFHDEGMDDDYLEDIKALQQEPDCS